MAQRKGVVEEGVPQHAWQRVHPLTPIFDGWRVIAVLIAVVLFQNIEFVGDLGKLADSFGFGLILLVAIGALLLILLVVGVYSYMSWRAMTYAVTAAVSAEAGDLVPSAAPCPAGAHSGS